MTGQELFIYAMDLCGLMREDSAIPSDAADLQQRAVSLINIVIAENAILDSRIRKIEHSVARITELTDRIDCCDIIAYSVLPYGLARLMMLGDDDALAADMNKLYIEARSNAISYGKAVTEQITGVYE